MAGAALCGYWMLCSFEKKAMVSFRGGHRVYFSLFTKAEVDEPGCFHAYVCLHFSAFLHGLE